MKKIPRTAAHFLKMMLFASATLSTSYIWSLPTHSQNVIALQQTGKMIKGKVVDKNNQPLEGVAVYVEGADYGTETNALGVFELEVPENTTLVFSYLGYADVTQIITDANFLNIVLYEDTEGQLDEIVITALGIAREEKQLGYSQQKLSNETFTDARSNNWVDNMKGKVPGMSFTSASSGPMGSTQVVLRGNRSVDSNKNGALIVVDGIPINSGMSSSGTGNGYLSTDSPVDFGNGMSDINPEDIESVTVLKGAGATALYGSRAANGAIMITTKSGKNNQGLGITFNSNLSVDVIQRWPDWQTQYGSGTGKVFNSNGELYYSYQPSEDGAATQSNLGFGPRFNGQYYYQYDPATGTMGTERTLWQNYDNARKGFWRTGTTLTNSLSFAAGNDKGAMRASVTYSDNEWIMPNTGFERVAISTKGNYEIAKGVKLNSTLNYYNRSSGNLPSTGYNNHTISYFMILTNANNNIDWYRKMWLDEGKTKLNSPFSTYLDNPFALVNEVINSTNSNTFTGNLSLDIDFSKNLKLMMRSGINSQNEFRELKRPYDLVKFATGYYERQMINSQEINTDFLLTYKGNETDHFNYSLSAGGNIMSNKYRRMDASANGLAVPDVYKLSNASSNVYTESADANKKVNSLYALGSFSYRNLLFLDLTARNDWSSTLPQENNSYFYPSANLSFILSDAVAMPLWIDFTKLRASVAQVGNDSQPYIISKYYDNSPFVGSAITDNQLFNADLKPEETTSTEFGIDARLFGDRLGFDVAYYNTVSDNQILSVPLDYATGYSSQYINAGKVQNRGIEAMLYFSPIKTNNFQWRTTFTYAKNKNEILELAAGIEGGEQQDLASSGTVTIIGKVGGSTGDMYGYGFVRNEEGKIIYDANTGLPVRPTEETYQGNAYADWKGGWMNSFTYKGWSLGVTLDGSFGGKLYSQSYHKMMEHGHLNGSLPGREDGYIIGDGVVQNADGSYSPNTKKVAVPDYYKEYYRRANVEANTFDATWVKLREISIAYSFPKSFLERHKLKGLTVSAFGRNLYTWSDFPIYDPETAALNGANMVPGVEMGQLPSPATYGFNLKVSL
ncbi:SusC/RagA family TonB-linked outer membrane protein [Flavobacterium dauae]|uniref:SusC/RagA family TonB-linked outer membrane protein n=1 Tax=Flavobacterium dauae TaxID=1563479 RepID=UPI00101B4AF5|nr:SusC/RagA family TonB-linked outer membrane protein [Flavobacterium dauae]WLD23421.1 SusC/RagA family TonB-linked outer membrane protein [Flavobacterium dauae]